MDWNYIAGFFDGEGSVTHNGKGYRITVPQTDEGVLVEICKFTKLGHVIKLRKREAHWKDSWLYYIANKKDVCRFLKKTRPYLVIKREKSVSAIKDLEKELIIMARKKKVHDRRKKQAKKLRSRGLDYRAIGKKLNIDWGYARRLVLDLA